MFSASIYLLDIDQWISVRIMAGSWSDAWQAAEAIALCHAWSLDKPRLIYDFHEVGAPRLFR